MMVRATDQSNVPVEHYFVEIVAKGEVELRILY